MAIRPLSSNTQTLYSKPHSSAKLDDSSSKCMRLFQHMRNSISHTINSSKELETQKKQIYQFVQLGLKQLKQWSLSNPAFAFLEQTIPTFDKLKSLCDRFVKLDSTNSSFPLIYSKNNFSIIIGTNSYLTLSSIYKSFEKEIFIAVDLKTGEQLVISKSTFNSSEDFASKALSIDVFNQLLELSPVKGDGGILPLIELINIPISKSNSTPIQLVVQKWCQGGNLYHLLVDTTRTISNDQIKIFANDIFQGIILLRTINLKDSNGSCENACYHKDIKPENIFIHDGHAIVADLDSILFDDPATFGYAAPEVLMGQPFNESSLVYTLGLVFYFLFSKRQAQVSIEINDMLKDLGSEKIHLALAAITKLFNEEGIDSFELSMPWEQENFQLAIKDGGEALVMSMLSRDPNKRPTLNDAYEIFKGISAEKITFQPHPWIEHSRD